MVIGAAVFSTEIQAIGVTHSQTVCVRKHKIVNTCSCARAGRRAGAHARPPASAAAGPARPRAPRGAAPAAPAPGPRPGPGGPAAPPAPAGRRGEMMYTHSAQILYIATILRPSYAGLCRLAGRADTRSPHAISDCSLRACEAPRSRPPSPGRSSTSPSAGVRQLPWSPSGPTSGRARSWRPSSSCSS